METRGRKTTHSDAEVLSMVNRLKFGMTLQQLGESMGLTRERVRQIVLRFNHRQSDLKVVITDEHISRVVQKIEEGLSFESACEEVGISYFILKNRYKRMENIPGYKEAHQKARSRCPSCGGSNKDSTPFYLPRCLACGRRRNAIKCRESQMRLRRAMGIKAKMGGRPRKYE